MVNKARTSLAVIFLAECLEMIMTTNYIVLFVILGLLSVRAKPVEKDVERQRRIYLKGESDIVDVLAKTQAMVATLNSTLQNLLATTNAKFGSMNSTIHSQNGQILQLQAALQTETKARCQVGSVPFHHEECAKSQCSETIGINFNPHFAKTPLLMYGFSLLDIQEDRNLRIELSVVQVATDAATLKVRTWADSIVNWSTVRWMACPQ